MDIANNRYWFDIFYKKIYEEIYKIYKMNKVFYINFFLNRNAYAYFIVLY